MEFSRVEPTGPASRAVDCYWIAKDHNSTRVKQKIIPDGFIEVIFHFGDHYRINLDGHWTRQGKRLLAGQISRYFYLENSGVSDMLGVKLKPAATTHLFGVCMKSIVDSVVDLDKAIGKKMNVDLSTDDRVKAIDTFFNEVCSDYPVGHPADRAVEIIFEKRGMITVASVCQELSVGERYLQQLFQKYVGLTPKFFARVVRFAYIFQLIREKPPNWADVVYEAGYYDQSHFIRNFKAFTGEDPGEYFFAEKTLANFFMKRSG